MTRLEEIRMRLDKSGKWHETDIMYLLSLLEEKDNSIDRLNKEIELLVVVGKGHVEEIEDKHRMCVELDKIAKRTYAQWCKECNPSPRVVSEDASGTWRDMQILRVDHASEGIRIVVRKH